MGVCRKLKELYPTHACKQYNYIFPLLEQNCGYGPDAIPQLQDVSDFLQVILHFQELNDRHFLIFP
jgi:phenylalanine-4-hydroxylase